MAVWEWMDAEPPPARPSTRRCAAPKVRARSVTTHRARMRCSAERLSSQTPPPLYLYSPAGDQPAVAARLSLLAAAAAAAGAGPWDSGAPCPLHARCCACGGPLSGVQGAHTPRAPRHELGSSTPEASTQHAAHAAAAAVTARDAHAAHSPRPPSPPAPPPLLLHLAAGASGASPLDWQLWPGSSGDGGSSASTGDRASGGGGCFAAAYPEASFAADLARMQACYAGL